MMIARPMKHCLLLSVALVCHLAGGCLSPVARCRVSVANAGDVALSSVRVRDASGTTYLFAGLKPHSVAPYVRTGADLGGPVTLEIMAEAGASVTNTVPLEGPVPCTFEGEVLFEIHPGADVRVFIQPRSGKSGTGVMPWAVPPPWQGAPSIPGLSGQE